MDLTVEAMSSKIILMMPKESRVKQVSKNQESNKFQESRSRFKNNQDQDSRFKIQVKKRLNQDKY